MFADFHFLSPEWFLALLPLAAILWGIGRRGAGAGSWQRVVDPNLLPHLLMQGGGSARWLPLALLAAGWLAAVLALANPTFERLPVPAYRGEMSRVVILDLSRSMETPDLEPSRLVRARYKVADILERSRSGQVGLVAFAGDAFVISPLTDDADTILAMLDAVVPEIMPVQGSRPDLAVAKATELLARAGASRGEVILVGDDAGGADTLAQAKVLSAAGHSLSVIGVGNEQGAQIPGVLGADGQPVLSRLDSSSLESLARAGGGDYAPLSADGTDLDRTLRNSSSLMDQASEEDTMETEVWRELGPWILMAVLPLGALAFRRGWLMVMALVVGGGMVFPKPAMALSWDDLWQRRDQQAASALARGDHEQALDLADQPVQRGTASYRLGDFDAAAGAFANVDQADGHYNLGNALAKSGRLEEAIAAYDHALGKEPDMEDAAYNKALIEDLLEQQQQQQEQQSGDGGEQGQDGDQSREQEDRDQSQGDDSKSDQPSGDQSQQAEQGGESDQEDAGADQQDEGGQEQRSGGQEQESEQNEDQQAEPEPAQTGESDDRRADQTAGSPSVSNSGASTDPAETEEPEEAEQAAADYREEAAKHQDGSGSDESAPLPDEPGTEELEAQQAANQWLRRIPDDPAGLLRRKFLYQYRSRAVREGTVTSGDPW